MPVPCFKAIVSACFGLRGARSACRASRSSSCDPPIHLSGHERGVVVGTAHRDRGRCRGARGLDATSGRAQQHLACRAVLDLDVRDQAADTLPDGDVAVTYDDSAVPSIYTVTVSWSEAGQNPTPYEIRFPVFEMEM